jgi:hypothetical protein
LLELVRLGFAALKLMQDAASYAAVFQHELPFEEFAEYLQLQKLS